MNNNNRYLLANYTQWIYRREVDYGYKIKENPHSKITNIVAVIILSLVLIGNFLIVFTIFKRKVLHCRPYTYVAHWCTCSAITACHVFKISSMKPEQGLKLVCTWEENVYLYTYFLFLTGNFIFACTLIIDWYILIFDDDNSATCRFGKTYLVWFLLTIFMFYTFSSCTFHKLSLTWSIIVCVATYFVSLVVVIVIFILRCIQLRHFVDVFVQSKLEFRIVFLFFICWSFHITLMTCHIFSLLKISKIVMLVSFQISIHLGLINALILFGVLYYYDKKFKKCFISLFGYSIKTKESSDSIEIPQII